MKASARVLWQDRTGEILISQSKSPRPFSWSAIWSVLELKFGPAGRPMPLAPKGHANHDHEPVLAEPPDNGQGQGTWDGMMLQRYRWSRWNGLPLRNGEKHGEGLYQSQRAIRETVQGGV